LNVAVTSHDGTRFPLEVGRFDRVLLDAPCSCEGNVRQTGVIPFEQGGDLKGRSGLQATLLGRAWKLLAPGGVLVYATCTFAPEENEVVLDYVLGDDATIEPLQVCGLSIGAGISEWNGKTLRPDCKHVGRFWPHCNDTGGFVVARIRKEEASQ
jgi:16S rRNA C967 or C1407 C5-methylase (RsmB/RsmF family)